MRNDALDDLDTVPSLRAEPLLDVNETMVKAKTGSQGLALGAVWALLGAVLIAFSGLAWWSHQQLALMQAQVIQTQETFARLSEEASGRIQDISGKVVANESSVVSDIETTKLRIKQLETAQAELTRQQRSLQAAQDEQNTRLQRLSSQLDAGEKKQQQAHAAVIQQLNDLGERQAQQGAEFKTRLAAAEQAQVQLKTALDSSASLQQQLKAGLAGLHKKADPMQAVRSLEQDLLILRSELDNRPAAPANTPSTAEFDAFRAQVTRNINALTSQVQNLQQQLSNR